MSSSRAALLSATFWQPDDDHLVELVHQRDRIGHRHLAGVDLLVYDDAGKELGARALDPRDEVVDLDRLVREMTGADRRAMVVFDARYDTAIFPYRPHHYAYLHRRGSRAPALYYAVNAVLGGVPDRIGATNFNNFETYVFRRGPFDIQHALLLGNLARFSTAEAEISAYYDAERIVRTVSIEPKAHAEVALPSTHGGRALSRVDVKSMFRLASYVAGRRAGTGDPVIFDHLFTYLR